MLSNAHRLHQTRPCQPLLETSSDEAEPLDQSKKRPTFSPPDAHPVLAHAYAAFPGKTNIRPHSGRYSATRVSALWAYQGAASYRHLECNTYLAIHP